MPIIAPRRAPLAFAATVLAGGCALFQHVHVPGATLSDVDVPLHGHGLKVHLSRPGAPKIDKHLLLLYATGDAGWFGKDLAIFDEVAAWGYPAAGFSAREYVHHIGPTPLRPRDVAADFAAIIAAAMKELRLPPETRVILVGKSRGAGLAVAPAGNPELKGELDGVLAVGLTKEEEYVQRRDRGTRPRQYVMLQTYPHLPALGTLPVAVIQSSNDQYVRAAEARQLFGPDTEVRRFVPIEADDHNFSGALDTMYAEMERSFHWIVER